MTLIDKAEALAAIEAWFAETKSFAPPSLLEAIRALPARGVEVKPDAAEMLAKEMQAIVAADRWKGRDLSAAPPEKWSHLRPETRQFWIDTATRILAALSPASHAPTDAAQAREEALREAADVCLDFIVHKLKTPDDAAVDARTAQDIRDAILALISEART